MTRKLKSILQSLGITNNETKIYLSLLQYEGINITQLARKCRLSRSSIYKNLNSLIEKGFINKELKKQKEFYKAVDIEKIVVKLAAKARSTARLKNRLEELLPEVNEWLGKEEKLPQIEVYEGKKNQQMVFDEVKEFAKNRILIANPESYFTLYPDVRYENAMGDVRKRMERDKKTGVVNRKIVVDSKFTKQVLETQLKGVREIKILPKEVQFKSAITVYGDRVIIYSQKGKIFTVVIRSPVIAEMLTGIFKTLWKKL